jgi:hypothetical protein
MENNSNSITTKLNWQTIVAILAFILGGSSLGANLTDKNINYKETLELVRSECLWNKDKDNIKERTTLLENRQNSTLALLSDIQSDLKVIAFKIDELKNKLEKTERDLKPTSGE